MVMSNAWPDGCLRSRTALDAAVESIMGNPLPPARLMGDGLIEAGKLVHGIFKIFWHAAGR
jgi:hypothetical protein